MDDPLSYPLLQISELNAAAFSITGMVGAIIALLILLTCSAFISGAEVAFFSLSVHDRDLLKEKQSRSSRLILRLLDQPRKLLATILIANNTVNIAIIIISTIMINDLLMEMSNAARFLIQVVCVTFLILLIGEVTPKVYATRHSLSFSGFMAMPVFILSKLFYPLSILLIGTSKVMEKLSKPKSPNISVDELSHALELTSNETTSESEQQILKGIVRFGNTEVSEIMQSRLGVTAFEYETPFTELLQRITEAGFSRVPVYKENFDNITGILYIKDLLLHTEKTDDFNWQELLRTPFFVPENKKIDDLLKEFQEKKIHLAIVVDEYGGSSGLVTLEDIIEEIVGDISDEFDDDDLVFSRLDNHNYLFEGRTPLNDFFRVLRISGDEFEKERGESDTIAGFILELEGRIPPKNTVIEFNRFTFKVEAADRRKIKTVKVTVKEERKEEE